MNEQLFRKKSIENVSSPEQLNEYIRVSNPGVWMVLDAIVILLIGVCVWGVLGHLDTTVTTVAVAENSEITVYVRESDIEQIQDGMKVMIGNMECEITDIAVQPVAVSGEAFKHVCCRHRDDRNNQGKRRRKRLFRKMVGLSGKCQRTLC